MSLKVPTFKFEAGGGDGGPPPTPVASGGGDTVSLGSRKSEKAERIATDEFGTGKTSLVLITEESCRRFIDRTRKGRMCGEKEEDCCYASHRGGKRFELPDGKPMLCIKATGRFKGVQVFTDLGLDVEKIPAGYTVDELTQALKPASVWRAYIKDQILDGDEDSGLSDDEVSLGDGSTASWLHSNLGERRSKDRVEEFTKLEKKLKTPARKKGVLETAWVEDSKVVVDEVLAELEGFELVGEEQEEGQDGVFAARVNKHVGVLENLALEQGDAHNKLVEVVNKGFGKLDQRFLEQHRMIQLLGNQVGDPGAEVEGDTVWGAVGALNDLWEEVGQKVVSGDEVQKLLDTAMGQVNQEMLIAIESNMERSSEEVEELRHETEVAFEGTWESMDKLHTEVEKKLKEAHRDGVKRPRAFGRKYGGGIYGRKIDEKTTDDQGVLLDRIEELERNTKRLKQAMDNLEERLDDRKEGNFRAIREAAVSGKAVISDTDFDAKLSDLQEQLRLVDSKTNGAHTFRSDDDSYNSVDDTIAKVVEYGIETVAGVRDVFGLFSMASNTVVSGMDHAKRIHTSSQIDRRADESDLLASYSHERPGCLFSSSSDGNPNKLVKRNKGFGTNCDTYNAFDGSSVAFKATLEDKISDAVTTLREGLDMSKKGDRLKDCFLRRGEVQARKILDFACSHYRTLTVVCKYDPKAAWTLVGRIIGAIFLCAKSIRAPCVGIEDLRPVEKRGLVLWTTMKVHNEIEDIIRKGFVAHPVIAAEVLEFQQENRVDASQMKALEASLAAVKVSVKEATDAASDAKRIAQQAKQDFGNLRTEVKAIKK